MKSTIKSGLVSLWSREIEMIENVLFSLETDRAMNKITKNKLISLYKDRLNQCKTNIKKATRKK